jgi:hypothetical protein
MATIEKFGVIKDITGYKVLNLSTYSEVSLNYDFFIQIELVKEPRVEYFRYTLTDRNGDLYFPMLNGWKCEAIFESSKHYGVENNKNLRANVKILDSKGDFVFTSIEGCHPNFINGIINKLNDLGSYFNASHYNLSKNILKLQETVSNLTSENEELKEKLRGNESEKSRNS